MALTCRRADPTLNTNARPRAARAEPSRGRLHGLQPRPWPPPIRSFRYVHVVVATTKPHFICRAVPLPPLIYRRTPTAPGRPPRVCPGDGQTGVRRLRRTQRAEPRQMVNICIS